MVIIEAILNHYIMLALMVGLWFMLESGVHVKKKIVDITKIIIASIFVEATLWSIEYWTRELDSYTIARPLLTATIYLLHSLIVIEMMNMSELKKDNERWIYVPFAVCVPLFYASQWTKWIFFYDRDNLYHASNAFIEYLPYYLFIFYVLIFMVRFYKRFSTIDSRDKRGIILGITVAMAGVGLNIVLKQDVDYSTLFAAILVLYYLFLYINRAKSDPLTKLLNRQCYYSDIKRDDVIITAVVSVDMNDLKMLNDNYGHDAGDAALVSVAECLLNGDTTKKHVYRTGGDEFMILYLKASEEEVKKDIDGMKEALKTTKYVCSFGYCMREDDDDIFKVAKEADAKMYKEKIKLKDAQDRLLATYKIATIEVMHEALHSGMWGMEFDENGKMCSVEWSPQFRKMIGFTDENDFPNTLEAWSSRLHPDEKEYVLKEFNDTINDYSNNKTYDVRYRLQVKDGQWKKFHALGRIIRREDGTPYSYVGMFVEVTDEKNVGNILHN